MLRLLYDTDLIGDDLFTLIAAAGAEDISIEAVTAFGRRIPAIERAKIAATLLGTLGLEDIPIAAGADRPLSRDPRVGCTACDEPIMNFYETQSQLPKIEGGIRDMVSGIPATQLITNMLKQSPGEITLLCTGPLTNVAQAYQKAPEIAELAKQVVIMGGSAWRRGNASPVAESNIYSDPEAAAVVFKNFFPIVMVGLDVTMKTVIEATDIREVPIRNPSLRALIHGIIDACANKHVEKGEGSIMPLHDPLSLLVAETPSLVQAVACSVSIDLGGDDTRGRTVCKASKPGESGPPVVQVASEVDADRAKELFLEYLQNACSE